MVYAPKRRGNKRRYVSKAKKMKNAPRVSKPLKTAIQRIVNKDIETKFVTRFQNPTQFNAVITAKTEWMYPFPNVYQAGTTGNPANAGTRVGNTIRPISAKIYATLSVPNLQESVDIMVVFWVFTTKRAKALSSIQNDPQIDATDFLDQGNGVYQPWDGAIISHGLPVNREQYNVISYKTFRLAKGVGFQNLGTVSDTQSVDGASTTCRQFTIDLPVPNTLHYDGDLTINPTNFCPLMAVGYYLPDGSPVTPTDRALLFTYRCNMYYKDA